MAPYLPTWQHLEGVDHVRRTVGGLGVEPGPVLEGGDTMSYSVTQRKGERRLYASESADVDGFAIPSWTQRPEYALTFSDRCDAEDCANERYIRGQYLRGYTIAVVEGATR